MLKGKVAIVTGSTSGIGLGIAKELAKVGADLVLNGFGDAGEIETIRSGIERDHGVHVVYDDADMSKGNAVRGLIAATIEKFGRLDILVNNAGIQFTAPVDEFPAAKWDAILGINLSAAFHGIAAAVPQMKKRRWGRIVNIASAHGLVASTHKAAYVAAKHGLVGLTKVVGLETAGERRHLQRGLSRLGAHAVGRKADQRHRRAARHQPKGGRQGAAVREATVS
ncbi:NAD(P)-dependent dehydrogenase (short-subunit alcohol dehydrogenase family) [Bradyrhizobium sp. LB7.2]